MVIVLQALFFIFFTMKTNERARMSVHEISIQQHAYHGAAIFDTHNEISRDGTHRV
jgi:hypothetical protein